MLQFKRINIEIKLKCGNVFMEFEYMSLKNRFEFFQPHSGRV